MVRDSRLLRAASMATVAGEAEPEFEVLAGGLGGFGEPRIKQDQQAAVAAVAVFLTISLVPAGEVRRGSISGRRAKRYSRSRWNSSVRVPRVRGLRGGLLGRAHQLAPPLGSQASQPGIDLERAGTERFTPRSTNPNGNRVSTCTGPKVVHAAPGQLNLIVPGWPGPPGNTDVNNLGSE